MFVGGFIRFDYLHYENKLTKNIRPTDILQIYVCYYLANGLKYTKYLVNVPKFTKSLANS